MADLTREQLRQVLIDLGETPVPSWTKVELRHRISEKTGEDMSKNVKTQNKVLSPCQQLVKDLNRASNKKKADLVAFCSDTLGMTVPVNRTMAQLQMDAMKQIMATTPPHHTDVVGFGKHSGCSYQDILIRYPDYATWVQQTYAEKKDSCDARLQRLALWLESQEKEELQVPETPLNKFRGYPKKKATTSAASASSSTMLDPGHAVLSEMLGAINDLRQEVAALKQEPVRKKPAKVDESETETDGSFLRVPTKK